MDRRDNGILIAVEGIDGAGKTTQVRLLQEALLSCGEPVVVSKEPTDGPWGRKIRESAKNGRLAPDEELEAFVEDRKQHVAHVIAPALADGKTLILDRFFYSTIAYQGARGGNVERLTEQMLALAPTPDVVLLLDVASAIALPRIANGRGETPNFFEQPETLERVRGIFLDLAQRLPNICAIDAAGSIDAVRRQIASVLAEGVFRRKRCAKSYGCDIFYCTEAKLAECRWFVIQKALRT